MPIVSSVVLLDSTQIDGRRDIYEVHTDQTGVEVCVSYLAEPGDDVAAILAARAAQISADLAAAELAANLLEVEA